VIVGYAAAVGGRPVESPKSALGTLPFTRWVRRLRHGHARVRGRCLGEVAIPTGDAALTVRPGPVELALTFEGGEHPVIGRVEVHGALAIGAATGRSLVLTEGELVLDGVSVGRAAPGPVVQALIEHVADVALDARAEPDGDLVLDLGHGVQVQIPGGVLLTVAGATVGLPADLRLCEPLVVGFGGEGLRLNHDTFRLLSRLANIRLAGATLHPDGSVALEGRAARGVDLALRGGLQKASVRLSDMVRGSPKFGKVRAFLKHSR
jgi:hypothetical protein